MTQGGNADYIYGNRNPAVWFHPNSLSLHISSSISGNWNYYWNSPELTVGQWTSVKISQRPDNRGTYKYTIRLDGKLEFQVTNTKAESFPDTKLYVSSPWHSPAYAQLRNFKVVDHQNGSNLTNYFFS